MQRLKGKRAVITGAARGLGKALAQRMSDEGAGVVIGDINISDDKETAGKIDGCHALPLDVADYESCEAFINNAVNLYVKTTIFNINTIIVLCA